MSFSVTIEVSMMLLARYLKGFKGYPRDGQGEENFARCVQETCLSVGHAEAVLASFGGEFPTKNQIIECANSLRDRFEPKRDLRREWERECGPSSEFDLYPADIMAVHWMSFRDSLYFTQGPGELQLNGAKDSGYWADSCRRNEQLYPESMGAVKRQIGRMGWPAIMALSASPEPIPFVSQLTRNRKRVPSGHLRQITQADFDAVENKEPVVTWDDPDR